MKVLQINKFYYPKGGPERYMFAVSELLARNGHKMAFFSMEHENNEDSAWNKYFVSNIDYKGELGIKEQAGIFINTLYSSEASTKISRLIDDFRPDIAHVHNFSHQLTPSILHALRKKNVPIVMTLHDYKLVCPSYLMLNHGRVCDLCRNKKFFNCLKTKCYEDSVRKSLLLAMESYVHHNILHSYDNIAYFLCPSNFCMDVFKDMGFKGNFRYIPHFFINTGDRGDNNESRRGVVFSGRLSVEKGIKTLVKAAQNQAFKVKIIGDGPLLTEVKEYIAKNKVKNIELLGHISDKEELIRRIRTSSVLVAPSECYEIFGLSILEAFAAGTPVIGSDIGNIPELVKEGKTGWLFKTGDAGDLCDKIKKALNDTSKLKEMGHNATIMVKEHFSAEKHYAKLIKIYGDAINSHKR